MNLRISASQANYEKMSSPSGYYIPKTNQASTAVSDNYNRTPSRLEGLKERNARTRMLEDKAALKSLVPVSGSFLYFDKKSGRLTDLSTGKKMASIRKEGARNLAEMLKQSDAVQS
jgi:hypothetical protein